jgi:hypothetical protein|tara:strand:- start:578 stop:1702 length:1125 start_codon:yes stop_codon:yes gene_type:complete
MSSGVFLLNKDGSLEEMNQEDYSSEEYLQTLLENYPNLLAGEQINETNPRKWIVISREFPVPGDDFSGGRWSLDHLLLDQEGIPTLVEVKRSSDTRIRREVVGQMLDYAANAISFWKVETIRLRYESKFGNDSEQAKIDMDSKFENPVEYEDYWEKVDNHLKTGRIRLLFVADEIPSELKQIVEFLNQQMNPAEVLAIEIKQYTGQEQSTFVPRVIGQSLKTVSAKQSKKQWDESLFLDEISSKYGAEIIEVVNKLLKWGKDQNLRIWWGSGSNHGSCFLVKDHNEVPYSSFAIWTNGNIEIQFQHMKNRPVYDSKDMRLELLNQLNDIRNIQIAFDRIDYRPSIELNSLINEESLGKFISIWEDYYRKIVGND